MAFTDELKRRGEPIYEQVLDHPFVQGLGDGSLAEAKFGYYVKQDYNYLVTDGRVYALGASDAESVARVRRFTDSAHSCVSDDLRSHEKTAKKLGISEKELENTPRSPTTEAYGNFLVRTATLDSFGDLVVALLPCYWWYNRLAKALKKQGLPEKPVYRQWIKRNASQDATKSVGQYKELVNDVASEASTDERERYVQRFLTAGRYEYGFWDAAWNRKRWPVDPPSAGSNAGSE